MRILETMIVANPFITMNEVASLLFENHGIKFSGRTLQRYASELNYTYKKAVNVIIDHDHDNVMIKSFCSSFEEAYNNGNLYSMDEAGFHVGDHFAP